MMNIIEKLKNVPKGTKLYSPLFKDPLEFVKIDNTHPYPIITRSVAEELVTFTEEGYFLGNTAPQNCMIFPTPDMIWKEDYEYIPDRTFLVCEEKGNITQIICAQGGWYNIDHKAFAHWIYYLDEHLFDVNTRIWYDRFATLYEASAIPQILEKEGYELDGVNVKPKKYKFTPFEKVLVRDYSDCRWECGFFSHINEEDSIYPFVCTGNNCAQCIPYNNETAHLVGTTDMPPKKYITWE